MYSSEAFIGGHGERMAHEGPGEVGHTCWRHAVVTELPVATIEGVHPFALADHGAHGHATTDHLAVGADIRLDAEEAPACRWGACGSR
jgi:hypothetical protein